MATIVLGLILAAAITALFVLWRRNQRLLEAYSPIIDAEEEVRKATEEAVKLRQEAASAAESASLAAATDLADHQRQMDALRKEYGTARALYDTLRAELALLEENLEEISVGLYKPHYDYDSSQQYREALESIRGRQKDLVRAGRAAVCGASWNISGDAKAGQRMTKQYLTLVLRAFNGECDAAIAKVAWNNIIKMEARIDKAYETINEMGSAMQMRITPDYLALKMAELRLEYETDEKKHEELEEQRRIKEQMREEERALREAEKAKREAEEEEQRYEKALEKARAELAKAKGDSLELLQQKIQHLDAALHKAHEMKEKATSMAQLTRSGYVYVISNIGSFGEDVFKIGMTRRLEPLDRIRELGDASVPFEFDVHALVYSEDAPSVENALQTRFRDRAINLVNPRKEFFSVSIDEIESAAKEMPVRFELTKLAEARDYRQSLALKAEAGRVPAPVIHEREFPTSV